MLFFFFFFVIFAFIMIGTVSRQEAKWKTEWDSNSGRPKCTVTICRRTAHESIGTYLITIIGMFTSILSSLFQLFVFISYSYEPNPKQTKHHSPWGRCKGKWTSNLSTASPPQTQSYNRGEISTKNQRCHNHLFKRSTSCSCDLTWILWSQCRVIGTQW